MISTVVDKNLIIEGETGSGKTFYSIQTARENGRFVYIAPCRQLVYESFLKYSNKKNGQLKTGEVVINNFSHSESYRVYESLRPEELKNYRTLIIDEAHFINDSERGGHLLELIEEAQNLKIAIYLVTATRDFYCLKGFKIKKLKSLVKFKKKEVGFLGFTDRIKAGKKTCLLYTSPSPRDRQKSRMPSSA